MHKKIQPSLINIFFSVIKNLNLKKDLKTVAEFGEMHKAIKENLKMIIFH